MAEQPEQTAIKTVHVWRFKTDADRQTKDTSKAEDLGTAAKFVDLVAMSSNGYLGYTDTDTGAWLTYPEVARMFGEEPWASQTAAKK